MNKNEEDKQVGNDLERLNTLLLKKNKYSEFIREVRELYIQKFYYSCVVMSCVISECILRELFFNNINFNTNHLSDKSKKYLPFIKAQTICELLVSENIIQKKLLASFKVLGELQSKYSNIITKSPREDAKKALYHLTKILEQSHLD